MPRSEGSYEGAGSIGSIEDRMADIHGLRDNDQSGFEGGSASAGSNENVKAASSSSDSEDRFKMKTVEEVTFPSLDEALGMSLDLNQVTSLP